MRLLTVASLTMQILLILVFNQPSLVLMAIMLILAGFSNAVVNVILISTVQISTPQEMRGKVVSFMNATCSGLTPVAMALGGVLGAVLPLRLVITVSFILGMLSMFPAYFSKSFKSFIVKDYAAEAAAPPENI